MPSRRHLDALGPLETAVMESIWSHGGGTAREVSARLHGEAERAYTTVMTTLDRLHRKQLLTREKDGLAWRYAPALTKQEFERGLAESLAERILRGHGELGLAALVDRAADIDRSLLRRLEALIAAKRSRQK